MDVLLVSHTHWDREWYRSFQGFRARLVDTVDRVLDLLAADQGWRFLLDGQTVVIEDYLEIRPGRRSELEAACRAGRLAVGPWYVQPDSLLPSGEAHVRNLLEGRRTASAVGGASAVAYTPDSFGHPAQFPQLFAGFGLEPFVYWRGNGDEIDDLGTTWRWVAPDGTAVLAHHLAQGYFAAAGLPADPEAAASVLEGVARRLAPDGSGPAVLMNGLDHTLPDATTEAAAAALAARTGWSVRRGLLDDLRPSLEGQDAPAFCGELLGARVANLLPGVWSTRLGIKLANRRAEATLEGWAEPWAALGALFGAPNERPSIRLAWRSLLQSQAHDSICGCSQDRVEDDTVARSRAAEELGHETARRLLDVLAGLGPERKVPWSSEFDVAVFNPSPRPRTDVVRLALDGHPLYAVSAATGMDVHPWALAGSSGFTVDGRPARVVEDPDPGRVRMLTDVAPVDVEFVVEDVPAFGWKRVHVAPASAVADDVDGGREVAAGDTTVAVAADGTLTVTFGDRSFPGLCALEDVGDRGDTYDFDPLPDEPGFDLTSVRVERRRHPSGLQRLVVERDLSVPPSLDGDRTVRSDNTRALVRVCMEVRVAPGVERVDLDVRVENTAMDHRLRLLFPTGSEDALAATTFDVVPRRPVAPGSHPSWVHPPPATFPHQGWVAAGGLAVVAPGLPEAEVLVGGTIAVTVLRSVGWLARMDVGTRPIPAGPGLPTPGAQGLGTLGATLALLPTPVEGRARDAELGLWAGPAGPAPLVGPGRSLLEVDPPGAVLSALKVPEDGSGVILRLLNPTDRPMEATVTVGFPANEVMPVRLDETPAGEATALAGDVVRLRLRPHGLETVLLR